MSPPRQPRAPAAAEFLRAARAARYVLARAKRRPKIALVLGSGLGSFADEFARAVRIPYRKIPHFPRPTIEGHAGQLVLGDVEGIPVVAMQGRVHYYEGYAIKDVAFPVRVFARMGVRALVLTNAAGGINLSYKQGALVVLRDHINLQGTSPLIGPNDPRFGPRFPDMTEAYWKPYRAAAVEEARRLGVEVFEGVYAAMHGPNYETPAEIHALRALGADVVGMSTVPEVIVARHMGLRVLGISCVTNMAAGISGGPVVHDEVLETGVRVKGEFVALLRAVIPRMARDLG
jgi:purine-nucleoside phosphorylase